MPWSEGWAGTGIGIASPVVDWLRPSSNLTDDTLRTVAGGTTTYNALIMFGRANYGSATITVYLGGVLQGTAIADVSGNWNYTLPVLANATYSLTVTVSSGGMTSAVTVPFVFTVAYTGTSAGLITNFTALNNYPNNAFWQIDGANVANVNANLNGVAPWALQKVDNYAVRFEVRQGDYWTYSAGTDTGNNRNEVSFGLDQTDCFAEGIEFNISYILTIEPGPVNTGSWCTLTQVHATTDVPPCPFATGLDTSDRFSVVLQSPQSVNNYIYTTPSGLVRGRAYSMRYQGLMRAVGNGYARVWIDDVQVVNFTGAMGAFSSSSLYWVKFGIYRGLAPETISAVFRNVYSRPLRINGVWVYT